MIALIIEHLFRAGQLTLPVNVALKDGFLVEEINSQVTITKWLFTQPQMSIASLQALQNTTEFQTFLTNRPTILAREEAKKSADEDLRIFAKVLIKELNTLRTLHGLPNRTLAQFKAAMDNET